MIINKKFLVVFYCESSGREPVKAWLKKLDKQEMRHIGEDLQTLQYKWPIGMPLVKSMGQGIWELRSNLGNRIARIFFAVKNDCIFLLHAFIKKTEKTPPQELELARDRLTKLESQGERYYGRS